MSSISPRDAATQVRCAAGFRLVSSTMRLTVAWVRSRVEPPAPYVTETKDGASGSSRRIAVHSDASASAVLGGENSNETCNGLGSVINLARLMNRYSCSFFFCLGLGCGEPQLDGQFFTLRSRRDGFSAGVAEASCGKPAFHLAIGKAQAAMGIFIAQEFFLVRGKVRDQKTPARRHDTGGF